MASLNRLYPSGWAGLMDQTINLVTDTLKLQLVSDTYVFSEAHDTLADLAAWDIGAPTTLTGTKSIDASGNFITDTPLQVISAVTSLLEVGGVVLLKDAGPLIYFWGRTAAKVPIVVVPDSGDIEVPFADGIILRRAV